MKKLFFFLSIFLLFTSCLKSEKKPKASNNAEITKKIEQLYSSYGKSSDVLYDKPFDGNLFSPTLKQKLEEALNASKADIEKVKKSAHPDEKPMVIEGSLFTSLYEGYTSYKIQNIMEQNHPKESMATVKVQLENSSVSPKEVWTDTIHLINNSNNGWRIDNINFDTKANSKDLKTDLDQFISATKQ
ncbi:hypothetical protein VUJ46_03995 [Chryseobacterium sp. MYb264]|uniref:hypothetical protein n=1 Tax=Chryseobacterium sp. MYb264 TaxID=2745153 RepID=UPI002E14B78E|nr:hypothetical protein VUJ46_03995 [Chryseobacterium sp. MYb264]